MRINSDPERRREYAREWVARRKAEWFADKSCVCSGCKYHDGICGSTEDLELDHVDPATKSPKLKNSSGTTLWSWSEVRRNAELEKCQVLCKPCHRVKTTVDVMPFILNRVSGVSQFRGVYWIERRSRWRVKIGGVHVGYFKDEIEAARAYDEAAKIRYGDQAYLNLDGQIIVLKEES